MQTLGDRVLVLIFVLLGVLVGVATLYQASLRGTFRLMGLTSDDYSSFVDREILERLVLEDPAVHISCGARDYFRGWWQYRRSYGTDRSLRAFILGERRVVCGVRQVLSGSEKWGTYTIVKGIVYLQNGMASFGIDLCEHPDTSIIVPMVQRSSWYVGALLESTHGALHDVLSREYQPLVQAWRQYPCLSESVL